MIPNRVNVLTDPIVQDCLTRRDETIEVLINEAKETDKLKEHYKQKFEEAEENADKKRMKWWWRWLLCWLSIAIILYFTYKHFERWLSI